MIRFESDTPSFLPKNRLKLRPWLVQVAAGYGFKVRAVTYRFMTDDELLEINKQYLDYDYYTDIITFDNREEAGTGPIEADVCISVDRVRDNAQALGQEAETEMRRVMVHGLLHLCGLGDKTPYQEAAMRAAEDKALALWDVK
jgi:rRNA maturation RNase YbeY